MRSDLMSMRSLSRGCLLLLMVLLAGCSVPFPVYNISGRNVEAVRALPSTIKVGQFTGAQTTVSCRLQPIAPEGNQTFAAYVKKALEDEILIAGTAPRPRSVEISGAMRDIDVDCGILSASWVIEMDVTVNNGPPVRIKTVRPFDGNYIGAVVASRAYQAFVPTIQQVVSEILLNPAVQAAARAP